MSRWFRFYNDSFANEKVLSLSDREFRLWVRLLSIASVNDGLIPPLTALKRLLNARLDHLSTGVRGLVQAGLIDIVGGGYTPHNWRKFQYKSDNSTDRVKKHRKGERNVSVTPPDTETESETEHCPYQEDGTEGYVSNPRARGERDWPRVIDGGAK